MLHSEKKRNSESAPNRSKHVGKDTLKVIEMDEEISWYAVIASLNSQKTMIKEMDAFCIFALCRYTETPNSNIFSLLL